MPMKKLKTKFSEQIKKTREGFLKKHRKARDDKN